jgi:hypothetical protein
MKKIRIWVFIFGLFGSCNLLADLTAGLMAYYPFNGNPNDASGNGFNGVGQNVTYTNNRFGNPASALLCNGSSSDVEVANTFPMQAEQTITVWVNPATLNGYQPILEKAIPGYGGEVDFQLRLPNDGNPNDGTINFCANTDNGLTGIFASAISQAALSVGQWYFIACVIDQANNQVLLYVNGVLNGTASMGGRSIRNTNRPFRIGKQIGQQANLSFNGIIDDVCIYNRVLSPSEIQQLYSPQPLTIIATSRTPTTAESTPAYLLSPTPLSQLEAYSGGVFTTNLSSINPNQTTIVLTHGWIPTYPLTSIPVFTPNGIDDWPTTMAAELYAQNPTANIVGWNWKNVATSPLSNPQQAGSQTPREGGQLGVALFNALGPNYSNKIHFIGHSFGTLVNAYAANYLQGANWAGEAVSSTPWPATNMLMTLFDEAEVGVDKNFTLHSPDLSALINALEGQNGGYFNLPSYDHPLPRQFAWAENYVSEVGLLHSNAANLILTANSPANAPNPLSWILDVGGFHGYPTSWYEPTIQTDNSEMGYVWSFLWSFNNPAFANAPTNGSVYLQADDSSPYNLTQINWNYGVNFQVARLQSYGSGLGSSFVQIANDNLAANGVATGASEILGLTSWIINESTSGGNSGSVTSQVKAHPLGLSANDQSNSTNVPAYAWMQLIVPTNAVSLSFNYMIQGDWQSDSLAAAFNGTNVLLIAGSTIQTNVTFSSGSIDVSAFAGQTNEFFVGIVGGTSTNAQLTVDNLAFSTSLPPSLQALGTGGNLMLSWPMSAQSFNLQTTTNLTDPNSWLTLTNVPAIVNLQNTITNPIVGSQGFYRLIQSQ